MIENTISIDEGTQTALAEKEMPEKTQDTQPQEQDFYFGDEDTAQKGETAPGETVELTLYGEKVTLPLKEALAAAQKGLAFEHIKGQLADSKNDVHLTALRDIAAQTGQSTGQLVAGLQRKAVTDSLIARYGSIDAAPFEEIARGVNTIAALENSLGTAGAEREKQHWRGQLREFQDLNPGVKEIPNEVIGMAQQGENLAVAYSRFASQQLAQQLENTKRELEALKAESKSAKSSTPSAANKGAAENKKEDEFYRMMKSTW